MPRRHTIAERKNRVGVYYSEDLSILVKKFKRVNPLFQSKIIQTYTKRTSNNGAQSVMATAHNLQKQNIHFHNPQFNLELIKFLSDARAEG